MKMIGFREEYDIVLAKSKYNYRDGGRSILLADRGKDLLLSYLEVAYVVMSKTLALFDNENYIDAYMIYTDGVWVWPSYFHYYLNKGEYVCVNFYEYVKANNYLFVPLTELQKREATIFVEKEMLNT
jgi:hypothetical protein